MAQPTSFQQAVRRRWILIGVATALLASSSVLTNTITLLAAGGFALAAVGANALAWLVGRTKTAEAYFTVVAFVLDVTIVVPAIAVFGAGGLLVGLLAVLAPYQARISPTMNAVFIGIAALAYVAAVAMYGVYFASPPRVWSAIPPMVIVELFVFILAAMALAMLAGALRNRLRSVVDLLPHRTTDRPSPADEDAIEALETSLQRFTHELHEATEATSQDAATIAHCATLVRSSAEKAGAANAQLIKSSGTVVEGLEVQRRGAEAGERRGQTAAEYARELGERAATVSGEISTLLQHAESAQKQIQRSNDSLHSIEHDVDGTLAAIDGLKNTANAANEALQGVLSIARQTHVLALNTAIKSANGDISQDASTEIAARFRTLAANTSNSTRDAAQLLDKMNEHVAAAERAMQVGQLQTRDAVMFTETAAHVLQELHLAALRSNELVGASVDVTKIQAEHLNELSKSLSDAATNRVDTNQHLTSASQAVTSHRTTISELDEAGTLLAEAAQRLQQRFATLSDSSSGPETI